MRPFAPGRELAPGVRVTEHLARSHAMDVYAGWCARRACPVVLKTPRPDRRAEPGPRAALLREGRILRRLSHPHIVRAYEVHAGDPPVLVLETVTGETLAHLIARRRVRGAELAHLGVQLASALRHLHAHGVLHLDLKPSNVVAEAGRAKLLDLSVARPAGRMRAGRGTWCSMAPEQARGGEVGPAADVWGLGLVLHEAATGVNPFAELGDDHEHPQLEHRAPRVPRLAVGALVDACLEPDPARRPALDAVLAGLGRAAGLPAYASSA